MIKKFHTKRAGFTLVEIMIVVAIIALLAAIAVPFFLRYREQAQAATIKNDLRLIDGAVQSYATMNNLGASATVTVAQWETLMKTGTQLASGSSQIPGVAYGDVAVNASAAATGVNTAIPFTDVPASFYAPYSVQ